jgi:hypothetical protein
MGTDDPRKKTPNKNKQDINGGNLNGRRFQTHGSDRP